MALKLSTVDTTKTSTSSSSKTTSARKGPRVRAEQPVFSIAAAQWAIMNGDERNSYAQLTGLMTSALEPTLPVKTNAYSTFTKLSAANIATNQPLLTTAPPYAPAPPLPAIRVEASFVNGALTLTLFPDAPYPYPVAIKAARPVLAANAIYKGTAFKKIGFVPGLSLTTPITDLFQTRFRVPGSGYKIALELMGVAPGGYHTSTMLAIGIVGSSAAEGVLADPEASQTTLKMG